MTLTSGTRLAHYEIAGLLGAGGMGEVYAAHDARLGRDVAIKVLPQGSLGDEESRRRLIREARLAARLNHPHICTIFDVGESEGIAYIVMERVRGGPLDQLIRPAGLSPETVVGHGAQIADALAYAHAHGIVHRDLKSSNVLVTDDGRVKVLDFGLATHLAGEHDGQLTQTATRSGVLAGTPHYLAPELLRGGQPDVRSDLWSLGVVLYEMACGVQPFHGATPIELGAAILNTPPVPLPSHVPRALAAVIERCLAKDPAQRYRSAGDVRAALEAVGSHAHVTVAAPPRGVAWRWLPVLALALLVAAALFDVGGIRSRLLAPAPAARIASLAVLPLRNLSRDPDQQFFADGMTDELITRLAQMGDWRVTSRTSVMTLQNTAQPLPEIARKLGVDAIVEGSVERSGERVRITAQLIRGATDEHLWAQSYERDLRNVLSLQDEVAGAIANAVEGRLGAHGAHPDSTARAVSPRGYELYLRALGTYRHWNRYSDRAAVALLDQAIREDSSYAAPWAAIGLVTMDDPGQFGTRAQDVSRAREAVVRALALDPRLGLGYAVKAQIEEEEDWDGRSAEADFKRAIAASPNLFEAHHGYSHVLMNEGRAAESFAQSRTALALDPLNPAAVLHMGWYELERGQPERALERFQAGLRLDPNSTEAYRFLWEAYAVSGRYDEAATAEEEALRRGDRPIPRAPS